MKFSLKHTLPPPRADDPHSPEFRDKRQNSNTIARTPGRLVPEKTRSRPAARRVGREPDGGVAFPAAERRIRPRPVPTLLLVRVKLNSPHPNPDSVMELRPKREIAALCNCFLTRQHIGQTDE